MRISRNRLLGAFAAALAFSAHAPRASADFVPAFADSIIRPDGPRTTNGGTTLVNYFFNAEGGGNGTNASFAVADFSGLRLGLTSLSQLSQLQLRLTEANAGFTVAGPIGVYLSTDTTTNIGLGSPLRSLATSAPEGLGTQLNNALANRIGSFSFPTTGNGGSGQVDTIDLRAGLANLGASAQAALLASLDNGGTIRLVVAAEGATAAATYAGIGNFTYPNGAPTLAASAAPAAVPEPASLVLLGLGTLTLIAARCRRAPRASASRA